MEVKNNLIKKCKSISLYFTLLTLLSCETLTNVYYNDTSKIDDGEIWGSKLNTFFIQDKNIKVTTDNSNGLNKELMMIKKEIIKNGEEILIDDHYYDYAFVTKGDTLFMNNAFEMWRYQNKKSIISTKNIKKYLKISTNSK